MDGFLNILGVMVGLGLAASLPIGAVILFKALGSRIERQGEGGDREIEALHRRLADLEEIHLRELESVTGRVSELEERLDFAERMLPRAESPDDGHGGRGG